MKTSLTSSRIDPSSSHRLPTLSASQALKDLEAQTCLSTGIKPLDRALSGIHASSHPGGFEKGRVSEIWGPSGAGKTALTFSAAREALRNGRNTVLWIDCSTPLSNPRLKSLQNLEREEAAPPSTAPFHYVSIPGLTHLLALVLHTPGSFPPNPSLLVIDGLQALLDLDFPRLPWTAGGKTEKQKWLAGRRYAVLGSLISGLNKLAMLHGAAVVVTTGCGTRVRSEYGQSAALAPGVGGSEWEAGIWSRVVVFRDFNGRFAGVQKSGGRNAAPLDPVGEVGTMVPFEIGEDGAIRQMREVGLLAGQKVGGRMAPSSTPSSAKPGRKRFYQEIADSDDEAADEYGWIDSDEDALAAEVLAGEQVAENGQSGEES